MVENLGQILRSRCQLQYVVVWRVELLRHRMNLDEGEMLNETKSELRSYLSNLQTHKVSVSKIT